AAASGNRVSVDVVRLRVLVPPCMSPLLVVDRSEVAGKIRRLRIALEHRPERGFQWREPRFVMAPMVDAFAVDRHSHLLGTGRAHGTRILEEAQAAVL